MIAADEVERVHAELVALGEQGRFADAIARCHEHLGDARRPDAPFMWLAFLGYAHQQRGEHALAVEHLDLAIGVRDDDFFSHLLMARCLRALGRTSEALVHYLRAGQLNSGVPEVFTSALELTVETDGLDEGRALMGEVRACFGEVQGLRLTWLRALLENGHLDELRTELAAPTLAITERVELRTLHAVSQVAAAGDGRLRWLGDAEVIPIVNPDEPDSVITVMSNRPYVAELTDVTVIGGCSLLLDDADGVLSDLLGCPPFGRWVSTKYDTQVLAQTPEHLLMRGGEVAERLDAGVHLCGLASEAFGHWVPEFLTRLRELEQHPSFAGMPLLVDEGMPAPHYDYLRALVDNPVHLVPRGSRIWVRRLLVAPTPSFYPVELIEGHPVSQVEIAPLSPPHMRFLRDRVLQRRKVADAEGRFFLSRRNTRWRRLANDAEVSAALAAVGYETVNIEELTFDEQVALFQRARSIVAPNGSSLLNLIFAPPEVEVVVLSQEAHFNWGGWLGPMRAMGYAPRFFCGRSLGDGKHADYEVDVEAVLGALRATDLG